jgi:hypothetical protein
MLVRIIREMKKLLVLFIFTLPHPLTIPGRIHKKKKRQTIGELLRMLQVKFKA